jgi:hypothetical protein
LLCPEGKVASALSNINQWKIKGKVPTIDRMEKVIDNESALYNQEETLKNKEVRRQESETRIRITAETQRAQREKSKYLN